MNTTRWRRLKSIYTEAQTLAPDARADLLAERCGSDLSMREELASLLGWEADDPAFLVAPTHGDDADDGEDAGPLRPGDRVGDYAIVDRIATGGMGTVYRARRADDAFEKHVAIKVIRQSLAGAARRQQFATERRTLARLDHPHIARLLDGGTTDDGLPYLVMELVEGQSIDRYCATRQLPVRERLELFRTVCSAVHDAHRSLVVHRDLKPANILVSADGQVKLVDFGISRVLEHRDGRADATATAHRALTPEYASPEQVRGEPVTTATDVYSLGVVLYRLLADRSPYPADGLVPYELERAICEIDPTSPGQNADLDAIVMLALRKDPARRYRSVEHLDDDIARYLRGLPVRARAATLRYRVARLVRRRTPETIAAAFALLAVILGLALAGHQWGETRAAERRAVRERDVAQETLRFFQGTLASINPYRSPDAGSPMEILEKCEQRIASDFAGRPETEAGVRLALGRAYMDMMMWRRARPHLERALTLMRAQETIDVVALAECIAKTGRVLAHREQPGAVALLREGLDLLDGREDLHPLAAEMHCSLGFALWHADPADRRWDEAERHIRIALAMHERQCGSTCHEAARSHLGLAYMWTNHGRYDEAEVAYRDAIAIHEQLPTVDRYHVTCLGNLAGLLHNTGRHRESAELWRRTRAAGPGGLGLWDEHFTTWSLAAAEHAAGNDAVAEFEYRVAMALQCDMLADGGSPDAGELRRLAAALRSPHADEWEHASTAVLDRVAPSYEDADLLTRRFAGVADVLARRGRSETAAAILDDLIAWQASRLPADDPRLARTRAARAGSTLPRSLSPGRRP